MTLRTKLVLLLGLFCVFMVASVASAAWALGEYLHASFNQFAQASGQIQELETVRKAAVASLTRSLEVDPLPASCLDARASGLFDRMTLALNSASLGDDGNRIGDRLVVARQQLTSAYRGFTSEHGASSQVGDARRRAFLQQTVDRFDQTLAGIKLRLGRRVQAAAERANTVQRRVLAVLGANAILALALAVGGSLMVRRWLTRPILELSEASRRFARGDLDYRVPIRSKDELGRLSRQINMMAQSLAESQRRLVERERMAAVGELCSAVAHGIRNPLSGVISSAELVLTHGHLSDEDRIHIRDILDESERLSQRVRRLLDFARTRRMEEARLNVVNLLNQAMSELSARASAAGARFDPAFDGSGPVFVRGDREMLINALIEVLTNALEQPADERVVSIECTRRDGMVEVGVHDRGEGFSADGAGRAFDLFFTTKQHGSGIGLASVRKSIELHGGHVLLGCHPDGGGLVRIRLPEAASEAPGAAAELGDTPQSDGET